MSLTIDPQAFDRATAPLFGLFNSDQLRRLVALSRDAALDSRIAELAERAEEDKRSEAERAEYEGYIKANNLLAVLQGIARRRLEAGAAIDARTRRLVLKRAGFRCEYCLRHQDDSPFASLHLEHIVPRRACFKTSSGRVAAA